MFYVLASDSEGEGVPERVEEIKETVLKEEQFRVWKDDTRFKNEDTSIIFKSPFSKKNSAWLKPRFKEDEWVSIETTESKEVEAPPSVPPDSGPDAPPDAETPVQKFPSLLTRGVSEDKDRSTALAWAEKIKKSFDRADKTRFEFKKQPDPFVEKLSFFRRATLE